MPAPDYASEIASLEAAISTGTLRVEQDGEMVIYQSTAAMLKALDYFKTAAAKAAATGQAASGFGFSAPAYSRE